MVTLAEIEEFVRAHGQDPGDACVRLGDEGGRLVLGGSGQRHISSGLSLAAMCEEIEADYGDEPIATLDLSSGVGQSIEKWSVAEDDEPTGAARCA